MRTYLDTSALVKLVVRERIVPCDSPGRRSEHAWHGGEFAGLRPVVTSVVID